MEILAYRELGALAFAIGAVSLTITKADLFAWFRDWLDRRARKPRSLLRHPFGWLSTLFDCPYCMAHWITFVVMFVYKPLLISTGREWPDLIVTYFALVALGSLVSGAVFRVFGGKA